jgi:iron complex transport system substrate-binding protein
MGATAKPMKPGWPILLGFCFLLQAIPVQAATIPDMLGRPVTIPDGPLRLVSLAPSLTEIVFALGRGDWLAGVTDFCDYPPAARSKPRVGGPVMPNLERILELRPSLVLTTGEGNPLETVARLEQLGLRVFGVRPGSYTGVQASIEVLGHVLREEAGAARLVQDIRGRVAAVRRRVAGRPRPRVLFLVWADPLIAAGAATFVHDLIDMAGGDNIVRERTVPYPRLSWEEVVGRAPEVILVASHRDGAAPLPNGAVWNAWRSIPAVRSGRILAVHGDTILRPGPRVVEGVERLARAIHPETVLPEDAR